MCLTNYLISVNYFLFFLCAGLGICTLSLPEALAEEKQPDFDSMEQVSGGLLDDITPQYAYFYYRDKTTGFMVLKITTHYEGDYAVWKYIDHIQLPVIAPGHQLIYGMCLKNGEPDSRIAAVVKSEDLEELKVISHAWIANLEHGEIETLPTTGISCINEGYGV